MTEQEFQDFKAGRKGRVGYQTGRGTTILSIGGGCSPDNASPCPNPPTFVALSGIFGPKGSRLLRDEHARQIMEVEP